MGNIAAFEKVAGSMFNDPDLIGTTDQDIIDLCDGDEQLSEKAVAGLHEYMSKIILMNQHTGSVQSMDEWNDDRLSMDDDQWGNTELVIVDRD